MLDQFNFLVIDQVKEWPLNSRLSPPVLDWFPILVPDQMSPFNRMVTQLRLSPLVLEWFHILVPDQISPFNRMVTHL